MGILSRLGDTMGDLAKERRTEKKAQEDWEKKVKDLESATKKSEDAKQFEKAMEAAVERELAAGNNERAFAMEHAARKTYREDPETAWKLLEPAEEGGKIKADDPFNTAKQDEAVKKSRENAAAPIPPTPIRDVITGLPGNVAEAAGNVKDLLVKTPKEDILKRVGADRGSYGLRSQQRPPPLR